MDDATRHDLQRAARADLRRYQEARKDIQHLKMVMDNLRDRSLSASDMTKDKVQVQGNSSETLVCMIADLGAQYTKQQIDAEKLCRELEKRVSNWLLGIERRVIRSHYLYNLRLEQIALDENYSYRHIRRVHWRALAEYGKHLNDVL